MSAKKKINQNTEDTEREIRRHRRFDLAEAVGREAAGALKGASPVSRAQKLRLEVEEYLERLLHDPEGSLLRTILADFEGDPVLLSRHYEDPVGLLREYLEKMLASSTALNDLVRRTDARWGRDYQERHHFNAEEQAAHPDDPYTPGQVSRLLDGVLTGLD